MLFYQFKVKTNISFPKSLFVERIYALISFINQAERVKFYGKKDSIL